MKAEPQVCVGARRFDAGQRVVASIGEDFPAMLPQWRVNQTIRLRGQSLDITRAAAAPVEVAAQ